MIDKELDDQPVILNGMWVVKKVLLSIAKFDTAPFKLPIF